MTITDDKKLIDIQREFSEKFSHLRIAFYSGKHETGQGSPVRDRLNGALTIGQARTVQVDGDFLISEDLSVAAFEQNFYKQFGLNVQVFRKSGNLWMQTTSTDHWTLAEQDRKGGSSELHYKEKYNT